MVAAVIIGLALSYLVLLETDLVHQWNRPAGTLSAAVLVACCGLAWWWLRWWARR